MRKLLIALLSACLTASAFGATGFTTVTATNTVDATGNPLASGTATFQVVDASGHPLSVKLNGGGQIITAPVSVAVTNGTFTAQVVDVSQTAPSFPCVALTIVDNSTGSTVWQNNCLQPVGSVYDLDNFSTNTTPILPQAGDTVEGDLGVNGNLSVTGSLDLGGLSADILTANSVNGALNAAMYGGSDIGAKVNTAFSSCSDAAPCHVYIPPGVYTYSTPILVPRRDKGVELTCDVNATLTYTGVGDAVGVPPSVSTGNHGGTMIDGGCSLYGTAAASSGIHIRPMQGFGVIGWHIYNFSNGDGIWIDGANVGRVIGNRVSGSVNGIHMTGNRCDSTNTCAWDRPSSGSVWVNNGINQQGYPVNAVKVYFNEFTANTHYGAIEGDIVGGSNTKAFNNTYSDNDFEGNGVGAIALGSSRATNITKNYFEGNPLGVVLGCLDGEYGIAKPTGYTSQYCGNADKPTVNGNFFNDVSGSSEVLLNHTDSPTGTNNTVNGTAACLLDDHIISGEVTIFGNREYGGGSVVCQDGTPGGPLLNLWANGDNGLGAWHAHGSVNIDGVTTTGGPVLADVGVTALPPTGVIVSKFGPVSIWVGDHDPGGSCGSGTQTTADIWFSPLGIDVCQGNIWTKVGH